MDFEERLNRLTERHEALAQTVELVAQLHQEDHRRFDERMNALADSQQKTGESINTLKEIAVNRLDSIKRLERIALAQ